MLKDFHRDTRGVAAPFGMLLNLLVVTVLVGSTGFASLTYMDGYRDIQTKNGLDEIGENLVFNIQYIDRAVRQNGAPTGENTRLVEAPRSIGTAQYRVTVRDNSISSYHYDLVLKTGTGVESAVTFLSHTPIRMDITIEGGVLAITRPRPTQANVDTGLCDLYETNGEDGLQSLDAVDPGEDPDSCKIVILSRS